MTTYIMSSLVLLFISGVLQLASANHCLYNLTKPNQAIDVKASKGLIQFKDIGDIHVDGKTMEDRLHECVDICCHAGAGCNVVSLDTKIKGRDGDNCHLFKCDPPEDCKWTIKEHTQSALLYFPATTTQPPTDKTTVNTEDAVTDTESNAESTTVSDINSSNLTTSAAESDAKEETPLTTEAMVDGAVTPTTAAEVNTTGDIASGDSEAVVTTVSPQKEPNKHKNKHDKTQKPSNSTTVAPEVDMQNATASGEDMYSSTTAASDEASTTQAAETLSKSTTTDDSAKVEETTTARTTSTSQPPTSPSGQEDSANLPSTTSMASATDYDFDTNSTMTPVPLRAKTADMSSSTVTALACALAAGAMFVGIVATIFGKRFYDNWHRRHYQQIDYLVDGMYG